MSNRSAWFELKASEMFGYTEIDGIKDTGDARSEGPNMIGILGQHHQMRPQDPTRMVIRWGDRIDSVEVFYGDTGLGRLGGKDGKQSTTIELRERIITSMEFWGSHPKGDPPRLGKIKISFAEGEPEVCGRTEDEYLGILEVPSDMQIGALFGYTGEEVNSLGILMKHAIDGFYVNWMKMGLDNEEHRDRPLNSICLPASHDSATYALSDELTADPDKRVQKAVNILQDIENALSAVPGIDKLIDLVSVSQAVTGAIDGLATATHRSVYEQLVNGIRCLDLRIYYGPGPGSMGQDQFYIFHGLIGPSLNIVIDDIKTFAEEMAGEIIYITFGHLQNESGSMSDGEVMRELRNVFAQALHEHVYARDGSNDDLLFAQSYATITADRTANAKSTVILVDGESATAPVPPTDLPYDPNLFWPRKYSPADNGQGGSDRVIGHYTNTPDVDEMIRAQTSQFNTYKASSAAAEQSYALYFTLTPSFDQYIGIVARRAIGRVQRVIAGAFASPFSAWLWPIAAAAEIALEVVKRKKFDNPDFKTLADLSQRVNAQMYDLAIDHFQPMGASDQRNQIGFLYSDFYEQTETVAIAVGYTMSNGEEAAAFAKRMIKAHEAG